MIQALISYVYYITIVEQYQPVADSGSDLRKDKRKRLKISRKPLKKPYLILRKPLQGLMLGDSQAA